MNEKRQFTAVELPPLLHETLTYSPVTRTPITATHRRLYETGRKLLLLLLTLSILYSANFILNYTAMDLKPKHCI